MDQHINQIPNHLHSPAQHCQEQDPADQFRYATPIPSQVGAASCPSSREVRAARHESIPCIPRDHPPSPCIELRRSQSFTIGKFTHVKRRPTISDQAEPTSERLSDHVGQDDELLNTVHDYSDQQSEMVSSPSSDYADSGLRARTAHSPQHAPFATRLPGSGVDLPRTASCIQVVQGKDFVCDHVRFLPEKSFNKRSPIYPSNSGAESPPDDPQNISQGDCDSGLPENGTDAQICSYKRQLQAGQTSSNLNSELSKRGSRPSKVKGVRAEPRQEHRSPSHGRPALSIDIPGSSQAPLRLSKAVHKPTGSNHEIPRAAPASELSANAVEFVHAVPTLPDPALPTVPPNLAFGPPQSAPVSQVLSPERTHFTSGNLGSPFLPQPQGVHSILQERETYLQLRYNMLREHENRIEDCAQRLHVQECNNRRSLEYIRRQSDNLDWRFSRLRRREAVVDSDIRRLREREGWLVEQQEQLRQDRARQQALGNTLRIWEDRLQEQQRRADDVEPSSDEIMRAALSLGNGSPDIRISDQSSTEAMARDSSQPRGTNGKIDENGAPKAEQEIENSSD